MKNYYLLCISLMLSILCIAQNDTKNEFEKDFLYHDKYVTEFIDELKDTDVVNIIRLSDLNFVSNDTYIFWQENNQLFSRLISNRRLKKRIKNKKMRISKIDQESIFKLFDTKNDYAFLKEYESCESEFSHHYRINLHIQDNKYDINSSCLQSIKKNDLVGVLFRIVNGDSGSVPN
ncbi:hypothetical protein [Psychroserpens luteolus]|uniref:hypothetical protein n=1 Tax=Psychroserpens luteolus TaxID=2855840 RepID=UPI001E64A436|nr:hypothetical protein [Psychroserpens luteolus]MCD2257592.1 hypothetical protein [Psychroserpens luteolus]